MMSFIKTVISSERAHIYEEVNEERERQDKKWGQQDHNPFVWLAILAEEMGEASQSLLQYKLDSYREEMVQCAAVAIAAIESYDRGEWKEKVGYLET